MLRDKLSRLWSGSGCSSRVDQYSIPAASSTLGPPVAAPTYHYHIPSTIFILRTHSRGAAMDARNTPGGDIDWNDPMFASTPFEESMGGESPFTSNVFDNFTHTDFADSPSLALRTPGRLGHDAAPATVAGAQQQHRPHIGMPPGASTESSSQDSASDSSSRRKRKVTESPVSDPTTETGMVQKEETLMDITNGLRAQQYDHVPTRPMHDLSLEHDDGMGAHFDFNSAASSPAQQQSFNPAMSLNQRVHVPPSTVAQQYQQSPVSDSNGGRY